MHLLAVRLRPGVLPGRYPSAAWALAIAALIGLALPRTASAVPSFARQTGMPCSQCHTLSFGPALTPYGRQFKLNGYTWTGGTSNLPPIAAMAIPTFINVWSVILVNLGALAIAVLFSVLPALRAALLHPVQALRYE